MVYQAKPIAVRLWRKVDKVSDPGGCWPWTGSCDPKGYGKIGIGGRTDGWDYTHRVAYELQIGPIPDGLEVLHHCDNPPCTRGDHLFAGTQKDNMQDMAVKGRSRRSQTHCIHNHEYTPEIPVFAIPDQPKTAVPNRTNESEK